MNTILGKVSTWHIAILLAAFFLMTGCFPPPRTSKCAKPGDITAIKLPPSIPCVAFWTDDHYEVFATFPISEAEFRAMLEPGGELKEFTAPVKGTPSKLSENWSPNESVPDGEIVIDVTPAAGLRYHSLTFYGDPKTRPSQDNTDVRALNGLSYTKFASNGGGPALIFDRDRQMGYLHWAAW